MKPCINDCGEVATHGAYCDDCHLELVKDKRHAKRTT